MKTSPGMSSAESLPISEAFDTTAGTFKSEENPINPPKRS